MLRSNPIAPLGAVQQPAAHLSIALVSVHGDPLIPLGSEEAGGQNVYVREVARALARRGHAVDVYTRGRDVVAREVHALDGASVVRLPCGPRGFLSRNALYPHLGEFVAGCETWARAQERRYDVLHSNYWLSGWAGMRLAERWEAVQTHTHHSLGAVKFATTGDMPPSGTVRLAVEDVLSARCGAIVATSPEDMASLARYYQNAAPAVIVPCGVDAQIFRPGDRHADRRALGIADDEAVLLYVGRFDPNKGIDTFIGAAARVAASRPVRVLLAGGFDPDATDVDEYQRIRGLVAALGLAERTTFLGRLTSAALAPVYRAADVVVVPSHYESFGLVAIEAMGCGTPVVASETGGLRHAVVHRETGLLAPVRDEAAFAAAISSIVNDGALRARMARASARLVAGKYTWDAVAEKLEGLYNGLVMHRALRA